jgi:hypothetical protein
MKTQFLVCELMFYKLISKKIIKMTVWIAIGLKMYEVHEVFDVISQFDDYLNQILSPNLYPPAETKSKLEI